MSINVETLAAANAYTAATAAGMGAVKGKDGKDGSDGAAGKSAYQIAKENGFVGTEQEWLDSLKANSANPPTIGSNGNWFVWDTESNSYKDTLIKADYTDDIEAGVLDNIGHYDLMPKLKMFASTHSSNKTLVNGASVTSSDHNIMRFQVIWRYIYVKSSVEWYFVKSASYTDIIGEIHDGDFDGIVRVPEGAQYVAMAIPKTNYNDEGIWYFVASEFEPVPRIKRVDGMRVNTDGTVSANASYLIDVYPVVEGTSISIFRSYYWAFSDTCKVDGTDTTILSGVDNGEIIVPVGAKYLLLGGGNRPPIGVGGCGVYLSGLSVERNQIGEHVPAHWLETIDDMVARTRAVLKPDSIVLTLFADSHEAEPNGTRNPAQIKSISNMMRAMAEFTRRIPCDWTGGLGDYVSFGGNSTVDDMHDLMAVINNRLEAAHGRVFAIQGNHDVYAGGGSQSTTLPMIAPDESYNYLFKKWATQHNMEVINGCGIYDDKTKRIRYVFLNVCVDSTESHVLEACTYAAQTCPDGYDVIIFSHIAQGNGTKAYLKAFADAGHQPIAIIGGHAHPRQFTRYEESPNTRVIRIHASWTLFGSDSRTPGTASESNWTVIVINRAENAAHFVESWHGKDGVEPDGYTKLLPEESEEVSE